MAKEGTLLIVDDNRSILAALRLLLEKYFARVLTLPTPNRLATTLRDFPWQFAKRQVSLALLASTGMAAGRC